MERGERNLEGEGRGVVRWEMFLPRPFVRVLLVEGDNSTREIVSVLLRKCGYRGMFCSLDLFFFFLFLFFYHPYFGILVNDDKRGETEIELDLV